MPLLAVDIMPSQYERGVHSQDVQLVVPMGSYDYSSWKSPIFPVNLGVPTETLDRAIKSMIET